MDGRVRLTINALSQSFDYFGPYFLPDLEGAWIRFSSMTKSSGTKTCYPHPCLDPNTKETKIKLISIYYPPNPPIQNSPVLKERS